MQPISVPFHINTHTTFRYRPQEYERRLLAGCGLRIGKKLLLHLPQTLDGPIFFAMALFLKTAISLEPYKGG